MATAVVICALLRSALPSGDFCSGRLSWLLLLVIPFAPSPFVLATRAHPKSASLTVFSPVSWLVLIRMFALLMSRWMTPHECRNCEASKSCPMMDLTSEELSCSEV